MARLADLVTILYRPRATMRRILLLRDRWGAHVVFLASVCASANQVDVRSVPQFLPGLTTLPIVAAAALVFVIQGLVWVLALFILSWIARLVGRILGGTGTTADVRAALGWAMAPVVWSLIYRIPFAVVERRLPAGTQINVRQVLMNFIAQGGCSLVVLYIALQLFFALWCIALGCFTVAEAEGFAVQKGFITVVITIAFPLMVIAAAIFVTR